MQCVRFIECDIKNSGHVVMLQVDQIVAIEINDGCSAVIMANGLRYMVEGTQRQLRDRIEELHYNDPPVQVYPDEEVDDFTSKVLEIAERMVTGGLTIGESTRDALAKRVGDTARLILQGLRG